MIKNETEWTWKQQVINYKRRNKESDILNYPDVSKEFIMEFDASELGIGSILKQDD